MTTEEKAVSTLTRLGPFSARQAERYLEDLTDSEVAELVALHDEQAASVAKSYLLHQGGRFQDFLSNVADRLARDAGEKATQEQTASGGREPPEALAGLRVEPGQVMTTSLNSINGMNPGTKLGPPGGEPARYDRKLAEAAAGQAQSDGKPPVVSPNTTPTSPST